jgi:DNA-binding SARP family transcriptional activator
VRSLIILFSVLSYGLNAFCQDEPLSGLFFSSHEVIQEKRTSLNLTPTGTCKFPGGFSIEMEANFRRGDGYYGFIFRIIGDGHTNIDLVSNMASPSSNFWLVLKDKVLFSYKWSDVPNGGFDRWIKIKIDINTRDSKLSVSFNGNKHEIGVPSISGLKNFDIVFGACQNPSFLNTDVSPMSLKNIRVFDAKNHLIRYWKLSKHGQTKVYDETGHIEALVENPKWGIDKHIMWRKLKDFRVDGVLGITKDEETGRVFFVNNRAVYILSTLTAAIDTIPFAGGLPYASFEKQIIFNKFTNELWSYNFYKNEINRFSFTTHRWSVRDTSKIEPFFWHHNKFISPIDSSLITLFGYGFYKYKSIINDYDKGKKTWVQTDRSEQVQPRYLSASGFLNNQEVLVFGGYGSKTGRQELSPEFYYDLYSLNLNDFSFQKLWTLDPPVSPFVPCESLVKDPQSDNFYTLIYNSGNYATFLHLAKFGIKNNEYKLYNDSIPYKFLDSQSWSTLFLDHETSQLIAVTSHNSEVSLYSIAYPPLIPEDVYQSGPVEIKWSVWLIIIILAGIFMFVPYILVKNKGGKNKKEGLYVQDEHPNIVPIKAIGRKTISSILFMGGFQVFDRKSLNITSAFSPTLKQLFLIIFLYTIKNGKGVSSAKLDEVLWHDKLGDSARNNRNVNISKLRTVLDEIGGVEMINQNSFWKIKLEDHVFCDYTEIIQLIRKSKSIAISEPEIHELIALLSFGEFLPQIQTEWMDEFKSVFANEIIDGLSSLFKEKEVMSNFSLQYHLAECILVYDPLDDEAFTRKCSVLYRVSKKGMAKSFYDSFCRKYKQVLGIDYAVSFNDTVK